VTERLVCPNSIDVEAGESLPTIWKGVRCFRSTLERQTNSVRRNDHGNRSGELAAQRTQRRSGFHNRLPL